MILPRGLVSGVLRRSGTNGKETVEYGWMDGCAVYCIYTRECQ